MPMKVPLAMRPSSKPPSTAFVSSGRDARHQSSARGLPSGARTRTPSAASSFANASGTSAGTVDFWSASAAIASTRHSFFAGAAGATAGGFASCPPAAEGFASCTPAGGFASCAPAAVGDGAPASATATVSATTRANSITIVPAPLASLSARLHFVGIDGARRGGGLELELAEEGAARIAVGPAQVQQRPLHHVLDGVDGVLVGERADEWRIEGLLVAADLVLLVEASRLDARDLAGRELRAPRLVAAVDLERDRRRDLLDHVAAELAHLRRDEIAQRAELLVVRPLV